MDASRVRIAGHVLTMLDNNRDGALQRDEFNAPALEHNGRPALQREEIDAWVDSLAHTPLHDLAHLAEGFLDDDQILADIEGRIEGYGIAAIATGCAGVGLLMLALLLALSGVGTTLAIPLILGLFSSAACPIAIAEWSDAHSAKNEQLKQHGDHVTVVRQEAERTLAPVKLPPPAYAASASVSFLRNTSPPRSQNQ